MNTRNTKRNPESTNEVEMTDKEVENYISKHRNSEKIGGVCRCCKTTYKGLFKSHLYTVKHKDWIVERELLKKKNNNKNSDAKKSSNGKKNSNGKRSSDESSSSHNDSDDSDDPDYEPKPTKKPTNKKGKRFN